MIESISYRATRQLPKISAVPSSAKPNLVGINDILIKLSYLPSGPLAEETVLIIELNKTEIDLTRIVGLILTMDDIFNESVKGISKRALQSNNEEINKEFIKQVQKYLTQIPSVWEKYNKDMMFSIKVGRYYQQLDMFLHESIHAKEHSN